VASVRRQWVNALGKSASLTALGFALVCAVLAVIFAAGPVGQDGPTVRMWGAAVCAVLSVIAGWLALQPTWSVTVGKRGIGLKRLLHHRFIDYDALQEVRLDPSKRLRGLRIVTRKGSLSVFPALADSEGLAAHVETLARRRD